LACAALSQHDPIQRFRQSPLLVRTVPFLVFVGLTAFQGQFGQDSRYWFYLIKTIAGAVMIWFMFPSVDEMRWAWSWRALAVGVGVFALWVGLDGLYLSLDKLLKAVLRPAANVFGLTAWCSTPPTDPIPWNPHLRFGPTAAWGFVMVRLLGSSLVVPPLEEVFYRSFLYRYIARPDFERLPLNYFAGTPFLFTAAVFGFSHYEWLPGVLCGMLYQGLVLRNNRLGDAMTAHAITNFLLGLWIIWKGAWHFW
jgi:membrane protease YdiL (CAAX protease family)